MPFNQALCNRCGVIEVSTREYMVRLAKREHFADAKGKRESRIGHLVELSVVTGRAYQIKQPMLPHDHHPRMEGAVLRRHQGR